MQNPNHGACEALTSTRNAKILTIDIDFRRQRFVSPGVEREHRVDDIDTEGGQHQDINFWMSKDPEKVQLDHR